MLQLRRQPGLQLIEPPVTGRSGHHQPCWALRSDDARQPAMGAVAPRRPSGRQRTDPLSTGQTSTERWRLTPCAGSSRTGVAVLGGTPPSHLPQPRAARPCSSRPAADPPAAAGPFLAHTRITRTPRGPLPRGHQRSDAPSAATERPCAARLWESRRRHKQRIRRRVPAPPSDGRERERNLVERARPRSHWPEGARGRREATISRPRAPEDGAKQPSRALVERARPRSRGPEGATGRREASAPRPPPAPG
jgi:hypothetical protein